MSNQKEKPKMSYSQQLAEKRARVRNSEKRLRQAYKAGWLTAAEMRARLRELATEQVKEVGLEAYE